MNRVEAMIDAAIGREGGYVNHPDDRGGETIWGITVAVARANGYNGPMRAMPRDTAKLIYRRQYFERPRFHLISPLAPLVAAELFDTGVNMGPGVAAEFLQRALNVLTTAALKVDGRIGPRTIETLRGFLDRRRNHDGERVLVKALDCLQGARYIELTERRARNRSFTFGWLAHRIGQAA